MGRKTKTMPLFTVEDVPSRECYRISWHDEDGKRRYRSKKYGTSIDKKKAYEVMLEERYRLMSEWMSQYKNVATCGTQTETVRVLSIEPIVSADISNEQ